MNDSLPPPMKSSSNPPLVLIVEDEEPISLALTFIVEDAGYRALTAVHGRQALELTRQQWPDLIITDYMMPYLNGVDLMHAIRLEAQTQGRLAPPIIMMSAIDKPHLQHLGADASISKPFDISEVEVMLHRFLDQRVDAQRDVNG